MNERIFSSYRSQKPLAYDPNDEIRQITRDLEITHNYVPELNLHRLRYPTETRVVDTAIQCNDRSMTYTTALDKLSEERLRDYTYLASQMPSRGATIVTEPEKLFVGIEGTLPFPQTSLEFKSSFIDALSLTTHYVDHVHPIIKNKVEEKNSTKLSQNFISM